MASNLSTRELKKIEAEHERMESSLQPQDVKAALQQIIIERDFFRKEALIANQVIGELGSEIIKFDKLLADALRQLHCYGPEAPSKRPLPKNWIGTWQSSPHEYPSLVSAEQTWRNGNLQAALNQMPGTLDRKDFDLKHRVNVRLLYAAMISSSGANLDTALLYAEEALQLASTYHLYELARYVSISINRFS